ncbi:MAG: SRPBCC family protein [Solirubrobacterales bacterium]|nr:SRPBCC family protein [Solirubrobacterales bacterium]
MTMLTGESTAEIDAGVERCWAVLQDVARWPRWQQGLESVEVVETDAEGRVLVCDTVSDARVKKVACRVGLSYDAPYRVSFTRVESEDVDAMDGSWELEELAGDRTRATFRLALDAGPVNFMARALERALRPLVVGRRAQELAAEVTALD